MPNAPNSQEETIKHPQIQLTSGITLPRRPHRHHHIPRNVLHRLQLQELRRRTSGVSLFRIGLGILVRQSIISSPCYLCVDRLYLKNSQKWQNSALQLSCHLRPRGQIYIQHPQNPPLLRRRIMVSIGLRIQTAANKKQERRYFQLRSRHLHGYQPEALHLWKARIRRLRETNGQRAGFIPNELDR